MTFILKGINKNGETKYQSRVYSDIDKLRTLRDKNRLIPAKLTYVIYNAEGKVVAK